MFFLQKLIARKLYILNKLLTMDIRLLTYIATEGIRTLVKFPSGDFKSPMYTNSITVANSG